MPKKKEEKAAGDAQYKDVKISSGQELAKRKPESAMGRISQLITSKKGMLEALLPKGVDLRRLARLALIACRNQPKLQRCKPESIIGSITTGCQLGLEMDGTLGHAWLIPYKDEAKLQLGYKGMIHIADRAGVKIKAGVIYQDDQYEYSTGLEDVLKILPNLDSPNRNDPNIIAAYAVATLGDGTRIMDVLSREEIEKARAVSRSSAGDAWTKFYSEMAKKTAIRRLFKLVPVSPEMEKAVAIDEAADTGFAQNMDLVLMDDDDIIDVESEAVTPAPTPKAQKITKESAKKKTADKQQQDGPQDWGDPRQPTEEELAELKAQESKEDIQGGIPF